MKQIQKIGAIGLATVMGLTLAVSASYSDMADIVQEEAVAVLTATQIMEGDPDGTFRPDDDVTRAEMAKMMVVLLGEEQGEATDFTDCQEHWAVGYIATAVETGLVAGNGDGTFRPEDTVTGAEAAKMVLVALGNDETAYLGDGWLEAVEADSQAAQLLTHLTDEDLTQNLTRQEAAALLLAGLEATVVNRESALYEVQFPELTYEEGDTWYYDGEVIFTTAEEEEVVEEEEDDVTTETDDLAFIFGGKTGTAYIDGDTYYIYDAYLNGEYLGELKSENDYQGTDAARFYSGYYNSDGNFIIQKVAKTVNATKEDVINQAYLTIASFVDSRWIAFNGGGGVFYGGSVELNCANAAVADLTDNGIDSLKNLQKAMEAGATLEVAVVGSSKEGTVQCIYVTDYTAP